MIYDITRDIYVAARPVWARTLWERARGLIGCRFVSGGFDAMVFENCNAVHSCWMRMAIDIIFLDSANCVVACREHLEPWRFASGGIRGVTVIELPAGRIAECGVRCGDILNLNSFLAPEEVEKLQQSTILRESIAEAGSRSAVIQHDGKQG